MAAAGGIAPGAAAAAAVAAPAPGPAVAMNAAQLAQLLAAARGGGGGDRKLPAFSSGQPTEWLEWRMTFENMSTLKTWNEAYRCQVLRASVQGYAVSCLSSIEYGPWAAVAAVPAGPGVAAVVAVAARPALTSHQILEAYEAKFVTASNSTYARQTFLDAAQKEGEPLVQWHTRITMLYRRSEPNADLENTKELREHFIRGLINKRVKEHVMDFQPVTMSRALHIATAKAATIEVLKKEDPGSRRHQGMAPGLFAIDGTQTETRRCFNCDIQGHLARDCRQPKKVPKGGYQGSNRRQNQQDRPRRFQGAGKAQRMQRGGQFNSLQSAYGGKNGSGGGGNQRKFGGETVDRALYALMDSMNLNDSEDRQVQAQHGDDAQGGAGKGSGN